MLELLHYDKIVIQWLSIIGTEFLNKKLFPPLCKIPPPGALSNPLHFADKEMLYFKWYKSFGNDL